ncbi:MAG: hypothetical protein KatS3mg003_0783 [Candidatus Nitrosocaldaceae archaeon]|nr:MAG: hypothetical protein KatS3mg003_0783 [Candidatus Nitrosocaldaceae archaeon]
MTRRVYVSLPDGIWDILDKDFKNRIGESDSEVIRNIVIAYLSDRGYFINEKGQPIAEDLFTKLEVVDKMVTSLIEILEEKGSITYHEWEKRLEKKIAEDNIDK